MENLQVSPDGRWVIAVEDKNQVVVFSAADGREAGRLFYSPKSEVLHVRISPHSRRIITRFLSHSRQTDWKTKQRDLQALEGDPWRRVHDQCLEQLAGDPFYLFLTDDVIRIVIDPDISRGGEISDGLYRIGRFSSPGPPGNKSVTAELGGELLRYDDTKLLDGKTFKRLMPPAGRKLHPALKRLAGDGRFYFGDMITDTATEKQISARWSNGRIPRYFPGFGTVAFSAASRILPTPEYLEVTPELLELWAQVAVRGHLNDNGDFVAWNERDWENKRQELASKPAPHPAFPFPGHVAVDRFFWLRQEFDSADDREKAKNLAKQLLARANDAGDTAEAVRWIAVLAQTGWSNPSSASFRCEPMSRNGSGRMPHWIAVFGPQRS